MRGLGHTRVPGMRALLYSGSVTNSLVNLATHIIRHLGLAGVAGLNIASAVIGAPGTEVTMLFAGFNVYQHHLSLVGIIIFGILGDLVGASIAYAIGYYGLYELLERPGSPIHISGRRLDTAHAWFGRYGAPVIAVSRLIPLLRAAFPYAAGIAKVPYRRFIAYATLGSVVWITGLGLIGDAVGSQWPSWRKHLEYVDYAVVAIVVVFVVYLLVRRTRGDREGKARV
jgi:membrane protein DedA with SNARE-associated domain